MELGGKVALVTGAGAGIGRGCAIELARAGMRVVINDVDMARIEDAVGEIRAQGGVADGICVSMFDDAQRERIVEFVLKTMGRIDVLVTGPASTAHSPVTELTPDDFRRVLSDDLVSHCHLAGLAAQDMIARKSGGRIILISSVYGTEVRKKSLAYDTAKAGLNHAAQIFARELGQYGILVNAIAPGFTDTPGERLYADDEKVREIAGGLLLGKAGTPKDIGETAVFLAQNDYMTGQILTVAGGMDLVDYTYDKTERR